MTTARTRPRRPDEDLRPDELAKLFERLPPRAIETEQALLGSMILSGGGNIHLIGEVMQIISDPTELEKPNHQLLFKEIVQLYDRNRSIDALQLIQTLKTRGVIDEVGGADYIVALADDTPIAENAPYYAKLVHDAAQRRMLIRAAGRILKNAYEADEQSEKLIDYAEREIFEVSQQRTSDKPEQLLTLVQNAYEQLDKRHEEGTSLTGVDTGFFDLNDMLAGLQPSEMIIVAARPSMGKTAFALSVAEHVAFNNKQPIAVFSLEMSKQQLAERLLSARSGVDGQKMRRNQLNADEFRKLQEVVSEAYDAPMFIDDTPGISVLELRTKARRLASEQDIKAVFIDYMQLMSSPGAESRQQEVSEISRGIKALARELEVPIIALSQLNRNPEGRADNKPLLSDLRESGSIEQDADVVMMLHREEYYHKDEQWALENPDKVGLTELIVAKQRNGPTGIVNLQFDSRTTRFHSRSNMRDSYDAGSYAPAEDPSAEPPF